MNELRTVSRSLRSVWNDIPQRWRYALIGFAATAVSVAGVIHAIHTRNWAWGSRGGAVATMIAVFIVLLRPDYGQELLEDRLTNIDERSSDLAQLREQVSAIIFSMRINSQGQSRLNSGLVLASAIGTFFWGFGDVIAEYIVDHHLL